MIVDAEPEPVCTAGDTPVISVVIEGRVRDIGGFPVRRTLPSGLRRSVGPFIFVDHMDPAQLAPGFRAGTARRPPVE